MIKRNTFKQNTASAAWNLQVPAGATKARPLAAYAPDGSSIEIDSWAFGSNGILSINFGIDPVQGELEYEYQVVDSVASESNKPLVNIENNYGGVNVGTGTFPVQ